MATIELLKTVSLFRNFSPAEMGVLADISTEMEFKPGSQVFSEGSPAHSIFVIRSGTVEIVKEGSAGTKLVVALLSPGSVFGEMAFVDRAPRAATAVSKSNVKLLEIAFSALDKLVSTQPAAGLKLYQAIAQTLCIRVRQTTSDLSSLLLS